MSTDIERRVRNANELVDEDHLEGMFGDGIAARLLDDIRHRRMGRMEETNQAKTERKLRTAPEGNSASHRTSRWLVAAAAVVVVAGAGLLFAQSGEQDVAPTAGPTSAPTTELVVARATELDVATDMLETYYSGDMAFTEYFADDETRVDFSRWSAWFFGLGQTGTYSCIGNTDTEEAVNCVTETHNDLAELGGLPPVTASVTLTVEDGLIIDAVSRPRTTGSRWDLPDLVQVLAEWIHKNKPGVWEESFGERCGYGVVPDCVDFVTLPTWLATRENGNVMVELAPEFIDQNPVWPVSD